MLRKSPWWPVILVVAVLTNFPVQAEEATLLSSEKLDLKNEPCGDGWQVWSGIGDLEGAVTYRERITALIAHANDVWVGTSGGRLLTSSDGGWVLQGQLKGIQVTSTKRFFGGCALTKRCHGPSRAACGESERMSCRFSNQGTRCCAALNRSM